jgi:hypothetical protein
MVQRALCFQGNVLSDAYLLSHSGVWNTDTESPE